ncbi:two-component system, chemotaxis family, response regulator WspR [Gammaproteobacteria bacterium]
MTDDFISIDDSPPQVLIVDDSPINVRMLEHALKGEYQVKVAIDGPTALTLVEEEPPDLILLDVMMPGMDGYEVCQRLKNNPLTWHIPIIFVTARNDTSDQEYGFNLGAVDYISKPFFLPIVRARVRTHVNLKRRTVLLENLALLDSLTGIPNRRRFDEVFSTEWQRAARNHLVLSLLMVDVDHFKAFNDNYGHGAGDECLRKVATALRVSLIRTTDFVARVGGEEFIVILPECDAENVRCVAERIRAKVESLHIPHRHSAVTNWITVSVGCASIFPSLDTEPRILIETADQSLYLAKNKGRNQICG